MAFSQPMEGEGQYSVYLCAPRHIFGGKKVPLNTCWIYRFQDTMAILMENKAENIISPSKAILDDARAILRPLDYSNMG